jgi:hypothetical protein
MPVIFYLGKNCHSLFPLGTALPFTATEPKSLPGLKTFSRYCRFANFPLYSLTDGETRTLTAPVASVSAWKTVLENAPFWYASDLPPSSWRVKLAFQFMRMSVIFAVPASILLFC